MMGKRLFATDPSWGDFSSLQNEEEDVDILRTYKLSTYDPTDDYIKRIDIRTLLKTLEHRDEKILRLRYGIVDG